MKGLNLLYVVGMRSLTQQSPLLTQATRLCDDKYQVLDESVHSEHRYIYLEVSGAVKPDINYRNPRKQTGLGRYRRLLETERSQIRAEINNTDDIETLQNDLTCVINKAQETSCPVVRVHNKNTSCWTDELTKLRKRTRRMFKQKSKENADWGSSITKTI